MLSDEKERDTGITSTRFRLPLNTSLFRKVIIFSNAVPTEGLIVSCALGGFVTMCGPSIKIAAEVPLMVKFSVVVWLFTAQPTLYVGLVAKGTTCSLAHRR